MTESRTEVILARQFIMTQASHFHDADIQIGRKNNNIAKKKI